LDDLVLDLSDYAMYHPGGYFLIEHMIGKDISQFFFGGKYFLKTGCNHSIPAMKIANSMVIGVIHGHSKRCMATL